MRKMKNSEIEWIGLIPSDWQILRNKYNFDLVKDIIGAKCNEAQLLSLTKNGIKAITEDQQTGKVPTSFATYQIVKENDIVMCLFDLDVSAVFSGISGYDGMISPAYKCLKCKPHCYPKYIDYYFMTVFVDRKYKRYSKNVRYSLSADEFMALSIIVPPLKEQKAIADFLDKKCSEIDALTKDIEKQIEVLKDFKCSIITRTVTSGFDTDCKTKKSRVDWLDEIPSHWEETRIGYESWIRARLGWKGLTADEYVDEGYPFLSAFNIQNDKLDWTNLNYIDQFRYDESPEIKLRKGDIVLVKDGAGIGKCAKIDDLPLGESTTNGSLAVITARSELNYKYLYFYFQSALFQNYITRMMNGMGVPHLSQEEMRKICIPLPSIKEQKIIADYLDDKCDEIDKLISDKQKQLDILANYKKSLIYEYVTGKKEVIA